MLLNGAAHIEETVLPFPQYALHHSVTCVELRLITTQFPLYALLHSVTCVQLKLITILGNCGCIVVASFLGVPSPSRLELKG
jgi:hypothetical protein